MVTKKTLSIACIHVRERQIRLFTHTWRNRYIGVCPLSNIYSLKCTSLTDFIKMIWSALYFARVHGGEESSIARP